jgi:hypothetical protein
MIITVRNQHRTREPFSFIFKGREQRFEWLAIWIIRGIVEVRTSMKTNNDRSRIQAPGLSESLT